MSRPSLHTHVVFTRLAFGCRALGTVSKWIVAAREFERLARFLPGGHRHVSTQP